MALTLQERRVVTKGSFERYQKAPKKEKTKMLDEFVVLTGYTRHHASWVLRIWEKRRLLEYTEVSPELKELLNRRYEALNPAELKREITRYQQELFTYSSRKRGIRKPEMDKPLLYSACVVLRSGRI